LIVFAALLVWLGVQWGLKPLLRLSREIAERKQTDLMPIDKDRVQTEVRPLVQAVNVHMARLESLICAQQRFIADASHQLKTPLTLSTRRRNSRCARIALPRCETWWAICTRTPIRSCDWPANC
jgi:HAMP domain-containing protein